jgi:hypothetical protein
MEIKIPILQDLLLTIAAKPQEQAVYPTSRLQKGLVMSYRGLDLAEEAVGFGLPVLKRGLQAFFPGDVELDLVHRESTRVVTAIYTINLVEKISRPGKSSVENKTIYAAKNSLADIIRRFPPGRGVLTALSSGLRRVLGWETTYEKVEFSGRVKMTYAIDEQTGVIAIEADLAGLSKEGVSEVIVMNEQGAQTFDKYRDSSGTSLSGNKIGLWDEVTAEEASFTSSTQRVAFSLPRVPGARLFRGRERIASRLAWSGFGYSFAPTTMRFACTVRIEKLP